MKKLFAIMILALLPGRCLILDQSIPSDGPLGSIAVLISVLAQPSAVYAFIDDSSAGDNEARAFFKWDGNNLQLIRWNGGPANLKVVAVHNGVIFAASGGDPGVDDLWISRNDGADWELVDLPSSNESTGIAHLLDCGSAIIATHPDIAYDQTGTYPAFVSRDTGSTWQEFRVGFGPTSTGTGDILIDAIDCNTDRLYVASSNADGVTQSAPLDDLGNWVNTTSSSAFWLDYTDIAATNAGFVGLAHDAGNQTVCDLNYSGSIVSPVQRSGDMPNATFGCNGAADFGLFEDQGRVYVAEADTTNEVCRVFRLDDLSVQPSASPVFTLDCSDVGQLGTMPVILSSSLGVFTAYNRAPATETRLLHSTDGGANFIRLDTSGLWSETGQIFDIEESP